MKKLILAIAALALSAQMFAQDIYFSSDDEVVWSVTAGFNRLTERIQYWNIQGYELSGDTDKFNGFFAGFGVDIPLTPAFNLYSGLIAMFDGGKGKSLGALQYSGSNFGVRIPVEIKWNLSQEAQNGPYLYAGPNFNLRILSQSRIGNTTTNNLKKNELWSGDKCFDIFLGGGLGYDFDHTFGVRFGYYGGVINCFKNANEGKSFRNMLIVGVSYYFD